MYRHILSSFLPPILANYLRKFVYKPIVWTGNFQNWNDAKKLSSGYDSENILNKVYASLQKVKNGEVVFERDGVLFDKIQYSWPMLSGLLVASNKSSELNVLDFGGSLGSTYFQNLKFLRLISKVRWNIVEQKNFVSCGRQNFQTEQLYFYESIEQCFEHTQPDTLLLSSVLQYIETPYKLLKHLLSFNFKYIIIDRTPITLKDSDIIKLQKVPESICASSYPCWLLSEKNILKLFIDSEYELIESFDGSDGKFEEFEFKGYILKKFEK